MGRESFSPLNPPHAAHATYAAFWQSWMEYRAVTKYLGEDRAEVKVRDLIFTVDQRGSLWQKGARFCPIELVLASLAS